MFFFKIKLIKLTYLLEKSLKVPFISLNLYNIIKNAYNIIDY